MEARSPEEVAAPATLASFIGRTQELEATSRLIRGERLVTLTGPGGSGKTRLAIELVGTRPATLLGFVELAAVSPGASLPLALLAGCGIRDEPGRDPLDRLRDRLRDQSGLLVLDNCEHLRDGVAEVAAALLRHCPRLRILATSRVPLGVAGEAVLPVAGLSTAWDADAVTLFLDRARRRQPGLPDGTRTRELAVGICRQADGLPLAIELAAAHAGSLSLEEIRTGMGDQLSFLSARDSAALPQHRSLDACIGWSMLLLNDDARRVLRSLSIVDGRFTLDAALAVAGGGVANRPALETLVDHSLVQFGAADERYVLLDTVRAYAARELAGGSDEAHGRLIGWVARLARTLQEALGHAEAAALQRVERDDGGVRTALEYALRSGRRLDLAADIVVDLAFAWSLRGRCGEGRAFAQRVSAAVGTQTCRLTWATAFLTSYAGDLKAGVELATHAAEQAAAAQDPVTQGRALILVGMALAIVDPAAADPILDAAVELAGAGGDDWGTVEALQVLAYSHVFRSDHRVALACADRALPALGRLGHHQLRAWDAAIRAESAALVGRFAAAESFARSGLALALAIEEPVSTGGAMLPLVRALAQQGRADEALSLVQGLRPFYDTHPGLGTSNVLDLAAAIAACWADPASARDGVALAYAAAAAVGIPAITGETGVLLAVSAMACGDREAAVAGADAAFELAEEFGSGWIRCVAALVRCVASRSGADAADRAHAVLTDATALGLRPLVADGLDLVAGIAIDGGRPVAAARLHAAAGLLRDELGMCLSPLARLFRPADEQAVAELLRPDELAAAHVAGAKLDLGQAVGYATRSRGLRARPRAGWDSLTPTERAVVALTAQGLGNQAIGDRLLIAAGTVRTHLRSIFGKLGVASRAELAAQAARRGL